MPILSVELVLAEKETTDAGLVQSIADAAGKIFKSNVRHTWVKLRTIEARHYAENDAAPGTQVHPVFLSVLKRDEGELATLKWEITQLTELIARLCHRKPEHVHVLYEPVARGRIAFGGKLVGE